MTSFFNKFKIPTLLGLSVIFLGIIAGVYLSLKSQTSFITQAAPDIIPQNITLTNISDQSVTISWQTSQATPSFITLGISSPDEQTVLDDRDKTSPSPRLNHYITIKDLQPQTTYLFKIISGKYQLETARFKTASTLVSQTNLNPVIGSVLDGETPINDGIVYLAITGSIPQSALIKTSGNFLIPLSKLAKSDLSESYQITGEEIGKLTVISGNGQSSAIFKLKISGQLLPPLKLGQNLDLTELEPTPQSTPPPPTKEELDKFDLNGDGQINANDHAIVLQNFGKNPKDKKADLNSDGVVDQKDVDLMAQKIKERGGSITQ